MVGELAPAGMDTDRSVGKPPPLVSPARVSTQPSNRASAHVWHDAVAHAPKPDSHGRTTVADSKGARERSPDATSVDHGSAPTSVGGQPVHPGVSCDVCGLPVMGTRWKAMTRRNFDLCDGCIRHPGHHFSVLDVFLHIVRPVAVNLADVALWPDGLPWDLVEAEDAHGNARATLPVNGMGLCLHDGVWCDGCDAQVVGARFRCSNCMDHDLCTQCYFSPKLRSIHDQSHCFFMINAPLLDTSSLSLVNLYHPEEDLALATGSSPCRSTCAARAYSWVAWFVFVTR